MTNISLKPPFTDAAGTGIGVPSISLPNRDYLVAAAAVVVAIRVGLIFLATFDVSVIRLK